MSEPDKKPGGFTVTDRRAFHSDGPNEAVDVKTDDPKPAPHVHLPPADFSTLVISLGSSAMMYLGEGPTDPAQAGSKNLPMAKHTIDLLSILEEKTKGNLTQEEEQLFESLLFDLRLGYVEALKKG